MIVNHLPSIVLQPRVRCSLRIGSHSKASRARCHGLETCRQARRSTRSLLFPPTNNRRCVHVASGTTELNSAPPKREQSKFDLPLAVALAGTAFEAYLEPAGAEGFQQVSVNGTKVTYTDRRFVAQHFQGLLEVKVVRAAGLPAADFTGKSDPYVVLTLGDSAARTGFKFQTLEPEWNETFFLYVRDAEDDILKVRVFDKDFLDSDDDLGVVMRGLKDLQPNEPTDLELTLQGNGGGGTIFLQVTLLPFEGSNSPVLDLLTANDVRGEGAPGSTPEMQSSAAAELKGRMNSDSDEQAASSTDAEDAGWASSISWEQVQGILSNIAALKEKLPLGSLPQELEEASQEAKNQAEAQEGGSDAAITLDPALMPKAWKVLASVAGKQIEDHFMPVAFVENEETDTQVWVYQNTGAREVVVAFRGTEQVKWKDFVTDLNLTPCSLNPERVDSNAGLPFAMRLLAARKQEEMVHMGFLTAYDSVKGQVQALVQQIIGGSTRPWNIYITGHSLGGALATLASYEVAVRLIRSGATHHVCMYTFGAPRVGNAEFATNFRKFVPDSWRITNANDIIPTVPRLMGYSHVKRGVKLSKDGLLTFEDGCTDVFGEGRHTREVVEELLQKVQDEKWEEVYESIQSAEMQMLNLLVSGEALEQHMETFYLQTLRECVIVYNPSVSREVLDLENFAKKD